MTASLRGGTQSAVDAAIAASHLRTLPVGLLRELTAGARVDRVVAGEAHHVEGDDARHFDLVLDGLLRVYVGAPDGRTMTVRYCRAGAILGAVSLFARPFALPATIQAVVDTDLLLLQPAVVASLAETDPRVSRVLIDELSERVLAFISEIPAGAFATVGQRVARHLLDLATEQQHGTELVASVTQQELAEAGGTVREVVVRILRDLRADGIVATRRAGIVILAPDRLLAASWNQGS